MTGDGQERVFHGDDSPRLVLCWPARGGLSGTRSTVRRLARRRGRRVRRTRGKRLDVFAPSPVSYAWWRDVSDSVSAGGSRTGHDNDDDYFVETGSERWRWGAIVRTITARRRDSTASGSSTKHDRAQGPEHHQADYARLGHGGSGGTVKRRWPADADRPLRRAADGGGWLFLVDDVAARDSRAGGQRGRPRDARGRLWGTLGGLLGGWWAASGVSSAASGWPGSGAARSVSLPRPVRSLRSVAA